MGISSSQFTNSYFSEGWVYNHQPVSYCPTVLRSYCTLNLLHGSGRPKSSDAEGRQDFFLQRGEEKRSHEGGGPIGNRGCPVKWNIDSPVLSVNTGKMNENDDEAVDGMGDHMLTMFSSFTICEVECTCRSDPKRGLGKSTSTSSNN